MRPALSSHHFACLWAVPNSFCVFPYRGHPSFESPVQNWQLANLIITSSRFKKFSRPSKKLCWATCRTADSPALPHLRCQVGLRCIQLPFSSNTQLATHAGKPQRSNYRSFDVIPVPIQSASQTNASVILQYIPHCNERIIGLGVRRGKLALIATRFFNIHVLSNPGKHLHRRRHTFPIFGLI